MVFVSEWLYGAIADLLGRVRGTEMAITLRPESLRCPLNRDDGVPMAGGRTAIQGGSDSQGQPASVVAAHPTPGTVRSIEGAGHYVQMDAPGAVIDAMAEALMTCRDSEATSLDVRSPMPCRLGHLGTRVRKAVDHRTVLSLALEPPVRAPR